MTTTRHRILILGHGETGQAMAHLLKEQQVDIWEKFPLGNFQSVILKNVYALLFGMADELELGDNRCGYFAVAAVRELNQIVCEMGGQVNSSCHLAGLGDLITTATSEDSHHHELGRKRQVEKLRALRGEGIIHLKWSIAIGCLPSQTTHCLN